MIMCMSDIICVTNRKLCCEDFLTRIERIAACHPAGIILREKDLSSEEYKELAVLVLEICKHYGVQCILHNYVEAALYLHADAIHLPLHILKRTSAKERAHFRMIGASCHSIMDAREAQELGATYVTAGHVFETDCKKELPGRGLGFLQGVCSSVDIPVYGIGGITPANIELVRDAGASGACLMSSLMVCEDVKGYLQAMEGKNEV